MLSLVMMWFLFVQFNASPIWIGAGCAFTFFYGRAAYRNWREAQVMSSLIEALHSGKADIKTTDVTLQEAPGDEKSDKEG